ncbi:hypothetical protein FRB95_007042 [Tulasnella sp. JGI-2019a]|nr:hypothetical protein FRB95_007042 [Tulasnella sp. JGI-2019a]
MLSDFGLAVAASEGPSGFSASLGLIGSVRWCSPELMDGVPRSPASDIWAWADLLVEIMKECVPYSWITDDIPVVKAVMKGVLPEHKSRLLLPVNLWSVTQLCWKVSPKKRATAVAVQKALKILIGAIGSYSISETTIPTSEPTLATTSRSRKKVSPLKSLGFPSFWSSPLASRNHAGPSIHSPESRKVDKEDSRRNATTGSSSQLQLRPPMDGNIDFTPRSRRVSTTTVASTKSRRKTRPKSSYVPSSSKLDDMAAAPTPRDRNRSFGAHGRHPGGPAPNPTWQGFFSHSWGSYSRDDAHISS